MGFPGMLWSVGAGGLEGVHNLDIIVVMLAEFSAKESFYCPLFNT